MLGSIELPEPASRDFGVEIKEATAKAMEKHLDDSRLAVPNSPEWSEGDDGARSDGSVAPGVSPPSTVTSVVVDANRFLRALTRPGPTEKRDLGFLPRKLFEEARTDSVQFTTLDGVIAEVVWVMTNQYHVDRETTARSAQTLLSHPGCRFASHDLGSAALDHWQDKPALNFPDSLVTIQAEVSGAQLATLDRRLSRLTKAVI